VGQEILENLRHQLVIDQPAPLHPHQGFAEYSRTDSRTHSGSISQAFPFMNNLLLDLTLAPLEFRQAR
jgi:hypothetical protein